MSDPLSRTALFDQHQALGARMVPFAGFEMPIQYSGVKAEHNAVRSAVGLFDVSHMGELWVEGDTALSEVNHLITNDLAPLPEGRALYTCCCKEDGGILDDLIVYKFTPKRLLIVCNASNVSKICSHFQQHLTDAKLQDKSAETSLMAVQGPKAFELLETLARSPVSLKRFGVAELELLGVPCVIARTGYTGEDGFELFCPSTAAEKLWRALLDQGAPLGAIPVGLAARDTLRLEACLALYGNDITEDTTPLEANLGWVVKFNKTDFIGKAALEKQAAEGVSRKLVGFEMTGRGIARSGYPLLSTEGARLGECTSGAPAPSLGKNIGLGYLPSSCAEVGQEILVDCRGKHIPARVVSTPFYRRPKSP